MQTAQQPSYQDHFGQTISDMADAIAVRPGENEAKQTRRFSAAVRAIMSFRPRDTTEVMLAGHVVMYHEVIVDNVQRIFRGEPEPARRATRAHGVAMDRAYQSSLRHLRLYQKRPDEGSRDAAPATTKTPVAAPKPAPAPVTKAPVPVPPRPEPSPVEVIRMVPRGSPGLGSTPPGPTPVCMASPLAAQAMLNAGNHGSLRSTEAKTGRATTAAATGTG